MMCGYAKELIAASWTGELAATEESRLRDHLIVCSDCSAEATQLGAMWERLADLPAPEPSQALGVRWQSTLESMHVARAPGKWRFTLQSLWPARPVWQVSVAATCLAAGLSVGSFMRRAPAPENAEIARLREEVANTKEMVALSLLQQQSASERLRGVDYSARMRTLEPEVVAALIQAVNRDPNVNVRLAAIDALSKVSADARVRQSMVQSLSEQDSPMVQAALIDYVVDARDGQSEPALRQLAERPNLNPTVRERARQAMQQLTQYR